MLNAIMGEDGGSVQLEDDGFWPEEPTKVIPADQLEFLRDIMDEDDRPTARFAPVGDELLAAGSFAGLPRLAQAAVCGEVDTSPRAVERAVTNAPAAERDRAWLIALGLLLLVVEVLALSW
jgi:hypothetical protein